MIYITGDCHGNFERFNPSIFPEQNEMTKNDFVIICGDFGGVWHRDEESKEETMVLDWLDSRPFTTLFVCGNHENFDRLYQYSVEKWHGGKIHKIMWKYAHEHKIEERLKENNIPDVAIQGEFCGTGIQKNRLKLVKPEWYVFTVVNMETGRRYPLYIIQTDGSGKKRLQDSIGYGP